MVMSAIKGDLDVILSETDFAQCATIVKSSGQVVKVNVIFDNADVAVDDGAVTQYVRETKIACKTDT